MKKVLNMLIFIILLLCFNIKLVSANEIKNISMDIFIDENGNATVSEVWNAYLTEGSEGYKKFSNLNDKNITNFSVSDESGKNYEYLENWNTNASFNEKAYKYGISNSSNEVELFFGISNYGNKTYTLKYNINNFVSQFTDTQGISVRLLDLGVSVDDVIINIHSNIKFSLLNSKIWMFGSEDGTIEFENGSIVLRSNGILNKNEYISCLVRFEDDIFNIENEINKSFDDVYDESFKKMSTFYIILLIVIVFFIAILPIILIPIFISKISKSIESKENIIIYNEEKIFVPKDVDYYRELPCNGNLNRIYYLCVLCNLEDKLNLKKGIIGAVILKFIKNGLIKFEKKDNNYVIDLSNADLSKVTNESDGIFLDILLSATSDNKILELKEFKKWIKNNYFIINNWFYKIYNNENNILEDSNLIQYENGFDNKNRKIVIKKYDITLHDDVKHILGLKKFLLDFSNFSEKEAIEVNIWQDYLIFAELLGITDKIKGQFSKLYPDLEDKNLFIDKNSFITSLATTIFTTTYKATKKENAKESRREFFSNLFSSSHDYSGSSRDSGGGGRSYSSGGSSSGSSGGGFR